jgi:DNA replication and repair protein RecF
LCGPHRDDYLFELNDMNIRDYGSQGQQRMGILSFKIAELEILIKNKEERPILLLDDVFSELDDKKKNNILKYIDDNIQTFITTTNIDQISNNILEKAAIYKIEKGKIVKKNKVK